MKPLVIGHPGKPRCFTRVKPDSFPVTYGHNKKSWMNRSLYEDWLRGVDKQIRHQQRKFLLFVDSASSHMDLELRNMNIVHLPARCTAILQPVKHGLLQALKFFKHQSRHVMVKMEKQHSQEVNCLRRLL